MTLVLSQMPFARSIFDLELGGASRVWSLSDRIRCCSFRDPEAHEFSQYLLVAPGKHGADTLIAAFEGKHVRMQGQLIYRDGQTMVEIDPKPLAAMEAAENPEHKLPTSDHNLDRRNCGQQVLSRCYEPWARESASRLRGALFERRYSAGVLTSTGEIVLLVNHDGKPFAQDALREFVDEVVVVRGDLVRRGEIKMIQAENIRHGGS